MTEKMIENRIKKLQALEAQQKELEVQADAIRAELKADLEAKGVDKLKTKNFVLRWKEIISSRLERPVLKIYISLLSSIPTTFIIYSINGYKEKIIMQKNVMLWTGAGQIDMAIAPGGVGVTISSQSGHRMKQLTPQEDEALACTPSRGAAESSHAPAGRNHRHTSRIPNGEALQREARHGGVGQVGRKGRASIPFPPGIIVTPLAIDDFNGPRGDFYKNMFAKCPAGRPGTADEVANVAELLMSDKGAFITGADFLIDGGATASYFYGPLKPEV